MDDDGLERSQLVSALSGHRPSDTYGTAPGDLVEANISPISSGGVAAGRMLDSDVPAAAAAAAGAAGAAAGAGATARVGSSKRPGASGVDPDEVNLWDESLPGASVPGIACCIPGCSSTAARWPFLQRFCTPEWFLVFLCCYVFLQSCIATGLISGTLSTIEKRFDLTSTKAGLIASTYDIGVLCVVSFVSYMGGRADAHKPRWLASGLLIIGFGSIFLTTPQWFGGEYVFDGVAAVDTCNAALLPPTQCAASSSNMYGLFIVGQLIVAFGASPLYTLGPAYLDEIVPAEKLSMFLGIFYSVSAVGPALGFLMAGAFLNTWVDPGKEPAGITPENKEWVGAWWGGFAVTGCLGIVLCLPLYLYPRLLPGTASVRAAKRKAAAEAEARRLERRRSLGSAGPLDMSVVAALRRLVRNPTFIFNCLGSSTEAFAVAGFSTFLPKAVQSMFGLTSSTASFTVGLVIIPGAAGGIFLGGYLVKRWKLPPKKVARMTWVVALIAMGLMLGFFIGCPSVPLAGVLVRYNPLNDGNNRVDNMRVNLTSSCNAGCNCNANSGFNPVCGADGIVYFSPCFAGCTFQTNATLSKHKDIDKVYGGCSCVAKTPGSPLPGEVLQVSGGVCKGDCKMLGPFLFFLFVVMVFTFVNNVPGNIVVLRCLQPEDRTFGLGVQNLVYRSCGTIPGPIIFGAVIDSACALWEDACGEQGACDVYDNWSLRVSFVLLGLLPKFLSFVFFFISWYFFNPVEDPAEDLAGEGGAARFDVLDVPGAAPEDDKSSVLLDSIEPQFGENPDEIVR